MYRFILAALAAFFVLIGCGSVMGPAASTGEVRSEPIRIPDPRAIPAQVTLRFGSAQRFQIRPGAALLIDGTIRYNLDQLQPIVKIAGSQIEVEQRTRTTSLPDDVHNEWDLRLGTSVPLSLAIEAGTYSGALDLGGVRLRELNIMEGATRSMIDFSAPNPEAMTHLKVHTGDSNLELKNLANANTSLIEVISGAGTYTLDFGGQLLQTAQVKVESGVSAVTITIPRVTPARVRFKGAISDVNAEGFVRTDQEFTNPAWDESKPHVDVLVDMGIGTLNIESK